MNKKIISIMCIVVFISCIGYSVYATGTTLKIDDVLCKAGEVVNVPITIFGNPGIAGAVVKILYDSELELLAVNQGDAFISLVYTPPAKLTSNPITLLWDGMEPDTSNGVVAMMQFRTPNKMGKYNISASYDIGGIYDGKLEDINVIINNGSITTLMENSINATLTDSINIELSSSEEIKGTVYVALYGDQNQMLDISLHSAEKKITSRFTNMNSVKYIKVFWCDTETLEPYSKPKYINLR